MLEDESTQLSDLCKSSAVNMYSRYKPIRSSKSTFLADSDFEAVNYGLSVSGLTEWKRGAEVGGIISPWSISYNKPTSLFRISDFVDYSPSASFVIGEIEADEITVTSTLNITLMLRVNEQISGSVPLSAYVGTLGWAKYYLGIYGQSKTSSKAFMYAEDGHLDDAGQITSASYSFKLPSTSLCGETYECYAILSSAPIASDGAAIMGSTLSGWTGNVVPMPMTEGDIKLVAINDFDVTSASWANQQATRYYITTRATITSNGAALNPTTRYYIKKGEPATSTSYNYSGSIYFSTIAAGGSATASSDTQVSLADYNNIVGGVSTWYYRLEVTTSDKTVVSTGIVSPVTPRSID